LRDTFSLICDFFPVFDKGIRTVFFTTSLLAL
jgi:hypothetical protein